MASMMKKAMIYLGLGPDEEYEQYEGIAAPAPPHSAGPQTRDVAPVEPGRPAVSPAIRPQVPENRHTGGRNGRMAMASALAARTR